MARSPDAAAQFGTKERVRYGTDDAPKGDRRHGRDTHLHRDRWLGAVRRAALRRQGNRGWWNSFAPVVAEQQVKVETTGESASQ
jgi:hypothetical protein